MIAVRYFTSSSGVHSLLGKPGCGEERKRAWVWMGGAGFPGWGGFLRAGAHCKGRGKD